MSIKTITSKVADCFRKYGLFFIVIALIVIAGIFNTLSDLHNQKMLQEEIAQIRTEMDSLSEALSAYSDNNYQMAETDIDALEEKIEAINTEITSVKEELGALDSDITEIAEAKADELEEIAERRRAEAEIEEAPSKTTILPATDGETIEDSSEPVEDSSEPAEETSANIGLTDEEMDFIAQVTFCEAGNESEYGQRLVIDTILNRVDSDSFPDSVDGVLWQSGQFSTVQSGWADSVPIYDDIRQLVEEETTDRTNTDVAYFNAVGYPSYGTALFTEGGHYFAGE